MKTRRKHSTSKWENLAKKKKKSASKGKKKATIEPTQSSLCLGDAAAVSTPVEGLTAGAALSVRFDTELEEIYVWGKWPSVHFKIQRVDLLQRGLLKLKEAKLSLAPCLESLEF